MPDLSPMLAELAAHNRLRAESVDSLRATQHAAERALPVLMAKGYFEAASHLAAKAKFYKSLADGKA